MLWLLALSQKTPKEDGRKKKQARRSWPNFISSKLGKERTLRPPRSDQSEGAKQFDRSTQEECCTPNDTLPRASLPDAVTGSRRQYSFRRLLRSNGVLREGWEGEKVKVGGP